MALLDFFLSRKKNTANIAKERLQIIVAEPRRNWRAFFAAEFFLLTPCKRKLRRSAV